MSEDIEAHDLGAHVAVCSERYKSIKTRLARIEAIVAGAFVAVLGAMVWVIRLLLDLIAQLQFPLP